MKSAVVLIISLFVISANAETKASVLKASHLEFTQTKCPEGKSCAAVVRYLLKATYVAMGCMDEVIVTVTEAGPTIEGRSIIALSAINIHNRKSKFTKCFKAPEKTVSYALDVGVDASAVEVMQLDQILK